MQKYSLSINNWAPKAAGQCSIYLYYPMHVCMHLNQVSTVQVSRVFPHQRYTLIG